MYKQDLTLNNLERLICHETQLSNQPKQYAMKIENAKKPKPKQTKKKQEKQMGRNRSQYLIKVRIQ